jgi:uncharacterized DUF497 family protein
VPEEVEQCYFTNPVIWEEQLLDGESRYLVLSETDAGRRLALVFNVHRRRGRLRLITAYPMTREQQELYEQL